MFKVMEEKDKTLKTAQQTIDQLELTSSRLEKIVTEKKSIITSKQEQVNLLLSQIDEEQRVHDEIETKLHENKVKSKHLKDDIISLINATTETTINNESSELREKVRCLNILIAELEEKYATEDFSKTLLKQTISAESAKTKCKNFVATLLKLANEQRAPVVAGNVRKLTQGLIDARVEPEAFTEEIQKCLNSSPQPCLVPFLKGPLASFLEKGKREIYIVDNENMNRSSKLLCENGFWKMNTLEEDVKPTKNAIQKPFDSLLSVLCTEPVVFLDLEAQGRPLGRLRIQLTCGPRRRENMIKLCVGQGGNRLKGHCFKFAGYAGSPGEWIDCCGYLSGNGGKSRALLVAGVEPDACKRSVAGAVTGEEENSGFCISTTTNASANRMRPELGRVLTGLEMLSEAIQQYPGKGAKQIKIVQAGLEINN